jgi:hypothetical protein
MECQSSGALSLPEGRREFLTVYFLVTRTRLLFPRQLCHIASRLQKAEKISAFVSLSLPLS